MVRDGQVTAGEEAFLSLVLRLRAKGVEGSKVLAALEKTPRQQFIAPAYAPLALGNCVIPIPCGEYIERLDEQIALLSALRLEPKHRVLEIGTGSGFTAAVMARLAGRVTTVERYKTLCDEARQRFRALGLDNIISRQMDGAQGAVGGGPFDRIVLWPACCDMPQVFMDMLASGGMLIAPVGVGDEPQTIVRFEKKGSHFERTDLFSVRYQPFIDGMAAAL